MKRVFVALAVLFLGLGVFSVPSVSADTLDHATVTGYVTEDGKVLASAAVNVKCFVGTKTYAHNVTTTGTGHYNSGQFDHCPDGSNILVTVGGATPKGSTTGVMKYDAISAKLTTTIDVKLVTVTPVPEFGPIIGVATAVTVGGGLVVVRRRLA
jgi:hypothetical protein